MSDSYSTLAPQDQADPVPDLTDLSSLTEIASRAESLLLDWMRNRTDDELPPPIKDITAATQALWRLTAVRKTLLGLQRRDSDRFDPDPCSEQSTELTDEEIEHLIRRGEEFDLLEDEDKDEDPALELGAATDCPESPAPAPDPAPAPSPPRPRSTTVPSCPTIPAISIRRVQAPPAPPAQTHASALAPPPPTAPGTEYPGGGAPSRAYKRFLRPAAPRGPGRKHWPLRPRPTGSLRP